MPVPAIRMRLPLIGKTRGMGNLTLMPYPHLVSFLQGIRWNTNHLFVTSLCGLLEVCTRHPSERVLYPGQIVRVLVASTFTHAYANPGLR